MKLMLIIAVAGGIAAMGIIPPFAALAVMGLASVWTMFGEVGQAKRAKARHVSSWWPGYLLGAILVAVAVVVGYGALGVASTNLEQVDYGIQIGGLLLMVFVTAVIVMMKFPRWIGNLLLAGIAVAALYVLSGGL
jgi:hypothetical protein